MGLLFTNAFCDLFLPGYMKSGEFREHSIWCARSIFKFLNEKKKPTNTPNSWVYLLQQRILPRNSLTPPTPPLHILRLPSQASYPLPLLFSKLAPHFCDPWTPVWNTHSEWRSGGLRIVVSLLDLRAKCRRFHSQFSSWGESMTYAQRGASSSLPDKAARIAQAGECGAEGEGGPPTSGVWLRAPFKCVYIWWTNSEETVPCCPRCTVPLIYSNDSSCLEFSINFVCFFPPRLLTRSKLLCCEQRGLHSPLLSNPCRPLL